MHIGKNSLFSEFVQEISGFAPGRGIDSERISEIEIRLAFRRRQNI